MATLHGEAATFLSF